MCPVPLDCCIKTGRKVRILWPPSELALDLAGVDRIPLVAARSIVDVVERVGRLTHPFKNHPQPHSTHFAGIIRTAYLYCPKILLTDAELLDGIFFLALGPTAVNGILGRSYKDGPAIVISGRQPTPEDCLTAFTVAKIGDVQQSARTADPSIRPESTSCLGRADQFTIRPLDYSALGMTITREQSLGYPAEFYEELTARLQEADSGRGSKAETITQMMAKACTSNGLTTDTAAMNRFAFLGQRWQEWIDAERQGTVLYEFQQSPEVMARSRSTGFKDCFKRNADRCADILMAECSFSEAAPSGSVEARFIGTLHALRTITKRSDAFQCIANSGLNNRTAASTTSTASTSADTRLSGQMLHDWYQFVYQWSLADHLGVELIAVDTAENSFARMVGRDGHSSTLMLDGAITKRLGEMPFVCFAQFCYTSRNAISRWRECTADTGKRVQSIRTRHIAYAVEQMSQEHSLVEDAKDMAGGLLVAVVLALASALSDNVWLNGNAPIWLIVLAAWLIAMVPNIIEAIKWLWGVHSASKTVVYLA